VSPEQWSKSTVLYVVESTQEVGFGSVLICLVRDRLGEEVCLRIAAGHFNAALSQSMLIADGRTCDYDVFCVQLAVWYTNVSELYVSIVRNVSVCKVQTFGTGQQLGPAEVHAE
jgi:hypothetical protein